MRFLEKIKQILCSHKLCDEYMKIDELRLGSYSISPYDHVTWIARCPTCEKVMWHRTSQGV
jgi:hypothetical protein